MSNVFFISNKKIPIILLLKSKFLCRNLLNRNKASSFGLTGKNLNCFVEKNSFIQKL